MRRLLGSYAKGLSDSALGNALLGASVLIDIPRDRARVSWWIPFVQNLQGPADHDIDRWRRWVRGRIRAAGPSRHGLAIELPDLGPFPHVDLDAVWLSRVLGQAERVSSVHFVTAAASSAADWQWPLDVAVTSGAESDLLRREIENLHWKQFVTPISAATATAPVELLAFPGSLVQALHRFLTSPQLPRVQAVLVLGGLGKANAPLAMAESLRGQIGADAVIVANVPGAQRAVFFDTMLAELSHDLDLDVAVAFAARSVKGNIDLAVARENGLARAHLSRWGRAVGVRLERMRGSVQRRFTHVSGDSTSDVGRDLLGRIDKFSFDSERQEASDIAYLGQLARAKPPTPDEHTARYVQAELLDLSAGEATRVTESPLQAGEHRLDVWIGAPEAGALVAPAAFPDQMLPPSASGHTLTIAFVAPGIEAGTQTARLQLPRTGTSERVSFEFVIPKKLSRFEGRIAVLHENRVLQTLIVEAAVGDGEHTPLELFLEAVVRRDLDAVDGRRPFDVALITNVLADQPSVSVFAKDRASLVPADAGIGACAKEIADLLEQITNATNARRFERLDAPGTTQVLGDLARKGVLLRDRLLEFPEVKDDLATAQRIQVISAKPEEQTLPLELCYDGPAPALGAPMCPNWAAALDSGTCQPTCAADHSTVVCPVAFWGTSRCIERHAYSKTDARQLSVNAYALQSEPADGRARLPIAKGALCAAAAVARAVDATAVDQAFAQAQEVARPQSEVADWAAWKQGITANPALLVLIAHTGLENTNRTLVIGKDAEVSIASIDKTFVGVGAGAGPVVLLFGCSTAATQVAFQSFVARFRLGGAAIVVGTLCEILGRHAGAVAAQLLAELQHASTAAEAVPLGDLVPSLRRQLMARGYSIALAIVPYGDADWRI